MSKRWKLHLPHKYRDLVEAGNDGAAGKYRTSEIGLSLYDLAKDPYEKTNLVDREPAALARLRAFAEAHRKEFYPQQL